MGRELKKTLTLATQRELERIIAKPVLLRLPGEVTFLANLSDYVDSSAGAGNEVFYENAIVPANLDPSTIQYAQIKLTNAEVLALFTTAKALIAAPGVGKVIEVESATISYKKSTAFTIGSATNLSIKYKDKTGADATSTLAATGFLDQATDQNQLLRALTTTQNLDANAVNQPVCLALLGANVTGGALSTVNVQIAYRVHTLV